MTLWMPSKKRSKPHIPTQAEIVERLKLGRTRLAEVGWAPKYARHVVGGRIVSYCMLGALIDWDLSLKDGCGGRESHIYGGCALALKDALRLKDHLALIRYCDAPGRTKEEVLKAYDRAIELSSALADRS